jgi:hypothetical protein
MTIRPHELGPFDWEPYNPTWRQRLRRRQRIGRVVFSVTAWLLAVLLITLPVWVFLI